MSPTTDAPADSSPAIEPEEGFAEFQAEQRANSSSVVVEKPPKDDPASERVEEPPKQEIKKPLTDEQKSAAKRANNERRWAERERELSALKAENERLKSSTAAKPAESATASKNAVHDDPDDPMPKEADYKGESALAEYVRDLGRWGARQEHKSIRAKEAEESAQRELNSTGETFRGKLGEYAETHEGFMGTDDDPGTLQIVIEALDKTQPEISVAIAESEDAAALIDYLGKNPEVFKRITEFAGNPTRGLIELGKIIASEFAPAAAPVSAEPKPRKVLPNPPKTVGGRTVPTGDAALDDMASKDELPMNWRDAFRARERRQG